MGFDDLLRVADHGLYKAKESGRNKSVIESHESGQEHLKLALDIENILSDKEPKSNMPIERMKSTLVLITGLV